MGRKAKHHYIPKCYLKGFTDGGEDSSKFWAVPKNNGTPFITSPNDSCAERNYYSVDHENPLIVEDFYAEKIEPKIMTAISYIHTHSCLPPKDEMGYLLLLLTTLYLRVPTHRKIVEMTMRREKEIVDGMSKDINLSNIEEFEYSKTDLIKSELSLIDTVIKCLLNKYYRLYIIEDDNLNVVTSDNPFILNHPKGGNGFNFGLDTSDIEICVPITSKVILIARNEKMKKDSVVANKEQIGLANTQLILSSSRFFYTKTEDILLFNNGTSTYIHNINTNKANHSD